MVVVTVVVRVVSVASGVATWVATLVETLAATGLVTVVAAMMFFSASATAVFQKVSNVHIFNGMAVYSVKLVNDLSYPVYCKLRATNGAFYAGWIPAYGSTPWMRINDATASFDWVCESYQF